ncbi:MAG: PilT/PilU family type 4a pilus ATPase [Acidimicrobiales bacterium]
MSTVATSNRTEWSRRLARALIGGGFVDEATMGALLSEASESDVALGALLIGRGVLPAATVVNTLAQLARLSAVDLQSDPPAPEVLQLLPPLLARDHRAVAVRLAGRQAMVAFAEPPDLSDLRSLGDLVGYEVVPVLADPSMIDRYLGVEPTTVPPPPPGHVAVPPPAQGPEADDQAADRAGSGGVAAANGTSELPLHIDELLRYAVSVGASDLHLTPGIAPALRVHGALRPMEQVGALDNNTIRDMIFGILPQVLRERFEAEHELDTSHSIAGVGRFRVNVALQRGTITVALRPIPHEIPDFSVLGLPDTVRNFAELRRGMVLVTGPTGSGKSTSLASLIDIINSTKPLHIVTVEDPIEFLHTHKRSVISQREVGSDTASFSEALRRVLRQDPDVILVGELRDLETISTALTAAETGHLVFATLHTQDAPATIDRIIDVFPPNQQEQIRIQLGSSLQGVVTQQLVPTADGNGRCVAAEVLVCTSAIQNLIRAAKTHQIYSLMQTGGQHGMQTMDQSLAMLVRQGVITTGMGLDRCRNEEDFRNHVQGVA